MAKAKLSNKTAKANAKKSTATQTPKAAAKSKKTTKTAIVSKIAKIKKVVKKVVKSSSATKSNAKTTKSTKIVDAKKAKPSKLVKTAKLAKTTKPTQKAKAIKSTTAAKTTKPVKAISTKVAAAKTAVPAKKVNAAVNTAITPLDDRVLVKVLAKATQTPGGLYIPESVTENENAKGIVVAVGRGHQDKKGRMRAMDVKVGQTVLFAKYAGSPINMGEADMVFIRENEILGIVD